MSNVRAFLLSIPIFSLRRASSRASTRRRIPACPRVSTSVSGLLGALAALQEINMGDLAFPVSDLNGDLNYSWTVPSTQPLAPDAGVALPA